MENLIAQYPLLLAEAAIVERLRYQEEVILHDTLVHAPLIYDELGKKALAAVYEEYSAIAQQASLPILLGTPTWRTNKERVAEASNFGDINNDAADFLCAIRDRSNSGLVKVGGILGCKNDCYLPEQGLSVREAEDFHAWQVNELQKTAVDFLMAVTLPNVDEALGLAKAMEKTTLPYIISFVIGKNGKVLDGTSLSDAIKRIDAETDRQPLGYLLNCSYPSFLNPAIQDKSVFSRLLGIQANASSLEHAELDCSTEIKAESVEEWGELMVSLNKNYGVKLLGGCCGTTGEHLDYLVDHLK